MAPRKVARLLEPLLADPDLGRHVVAAVADLSTGEVVFQQGGRARPASTTKLLTAIAALHVLGPDHRFTTQAVLQGQGSNGGSSWSAAATRTSPASRRRRTSRRTPPAPTSAPSPA